MVLARTAHFQNHQDLDNIDPVVIIDAPSFDGAVRCGQPEAITNQVTCGTGFGFPDFFASRPESFSGKILCGQILAITGAVICGGVYNLTADNSLVDLRDGGVSEISQSFNQDGQASVSNAAFRLINDEQLTASQIVDRSLTEGQRVTISLGFFGGGLVDYITIFSGVVDRPSNISQEGVTFELLDGSFARHLTIPEVIGGDVFPGAPQAISNRAVPIVIGHTESSIALNVETDASSVLSDPVSAVDTDIFIQLADTATFPAFGTITINGGEANEEVLSYGRREKVISTGDEVIALRSLTRNNPQTHVAGEPVVTTDERYTYLVGHELRTLAMVRDDAGTGVFTPSVTIASPGATKPVTIFSFDAAQSTGFTVDADGKNLSASLLANGVNPVNTDGWTPTQAALSIIEDNPPTSPTSYLRVSPVTAGSAAFAHQDVTVALDTRLVLVLYFDGDPNASISIRAGTPASPSAYVGLEDVPVQAGTWTRRLFVFTADADETVRITLRVAGEASGPNGFFRMIRLRPASDESPANVIRFLAQEFMPKVRLDEANLDALDADLPEVRLAGVIDFEINSRDLFEQIAAMIGALYFESARGRAKFVVNDLDGDEDMVLDSTVTVDRSVVYDRVRGDENIFTDFEILYDRDATLGTGENAYRGKLFASPDGDNHSSFTFVARCKAAEGLLGTRRKLTIFGYLIPDRTSAELLLVKLIDLHTVRTYDVNIRAPLATVHLEQADRVKVDSAALVDGVNEGVFRLLDKTISLSTMTVNWRARQLERGPTTLQPVLIFSEQFEPTEYTAVQFLNEQFEPTPYTPVLIVDEPFEPTPYNLVLIVDEQFES